MKLTRRIKKMFESTLDLFCNHEPDDKKNEEYADEYSMELEMKASILGITVDYYIAEFL